MRSICDLLVFKTPFEDKDIFEDKTRRIFEMIEDYNINSWMNLIRNSRLNDEYRIINYSDESNQINIQISSKLDYDKNDYFPILIINYFLDSNIFEKENIEAFLNDNIKLVSNVFFEEFFIDYDKNFKIKEINKWKKIKIEEFNGFDMKDLESKENKDILDSLMNIYYSLIKSIFDIDNSADEIDKLSKDSIFIEFQANAALYNKIWFETKRNLIENAYNLKKQMDIFLNSIQ